jgi:ankyrin repeat protein
VKRSLIRIAVILSALAMLLTGAWLVWRQWWSEGQLRAAVKADDADRVALLVRVGAPADADVEYTIIIESSPMFKGKTLHWAVLRGGSDIVKILLDHGADVNAKTDFGWTALHCALFGNGYAIAYCDIAEQLLAHGADVDATNNGGWTALHLAADHKKKDVAELLLEHGADAHIKNKKGKTPIDIWPELAEIVKEVEAKKAAKEGKR